MELFEPAEVTGWALVVYDRSIRDKETHDIVVGLKEQAELLGMKYDALCQCIDTMFKSQGSEECMLILISLSHQVGIWRDVRDLIFHNFLDHSSSYGRRQGQRQHLYSRILDLHPSSIFSWRVNRFSKGRASRPV